jgi:peptidyl-prolyl cis-trans isomerase C
MRSRASSFLLFCLLIISLTGCSTSQPSPSVVPTVSQAVLTATSTIVQPTATPDVPMAAIVNGEGIPLDQYQSELKRYQAGISADNQQAGTKKPEEIVIQDMIDQVLLAQGAAEKGFSVDDVKLQDRLNQLIETLGGQSALDGYEQAQGYSPDEFKYALRVSIASTWMRDQITATVPRTADQIHAQQIFLTDQTEAQAVLQEIKSGSDFATVAEEYDPVTRGDIGWFPRGYLTQQKVEDAAFALQPGGVSDVIQSDIGFHIIKVIERDAQHSLTPDAYSTLQHLAIQQWLQDKQKASQIEIQIK